MPLKVGNRSIGVGEHCFIAAEIGINHNGDLGLAREMIASAAQCGADAIKFQNYRTEDFIADRSLSYEYISQGRRVSETQYEMFKRYEIPRDWLQELKRSCDDNGVIFFSTPTSESGIRDLLEVGVSLFKNGSDYLVHLPLVRSFALTGLPTVLSTGMADVEEIDAAVEAYSEAGGDKLILLHCTSSYPAPIEEANTARIRALQDRYGCLVGFSDHTEGYLAAMASVAVGAVFIEKHFTLDHNLPGPDHRFSATPDELTELTERVRTIEVVIGSGEIAHSPSEAEGRIQFRLSCRASQALSAGTVLSAKDITISRPGDGEPPAQLNHLLGKRLVRDLAQGDPIRVDWLKPQ